MSEAEYQRTQEDPIEFDRETLKLDPEGLKQATAAYRVAEADDELAMARVGDAVAAYLSAAGLSVSPTLDLEDTAAFLGDPKHPDWSDYVATNLGAALALIPDTGDWHGALRVWCGRNSTGKLKPNPFPGLSVSLTEEEMRALLRLLHAPLTVESIPVARGEVSARDKLVAALASSGEEER